MTEPTLETLAQRLDRLERENHRLKIGGAILLLALAAVGSVMVGQALPKAVPKVVEAETFVLRDQNGTIRAALAVLADGRPGLALYDQNGTDRAMLMVPGDGAPSLSLSDQNGKTRAALAVLDLRRRRRGTDGR